MINVCECIDRLVQFMRGKFIHWLIQCKWGNFIDG